MSTESIQSENKLFPVFLKLENLKLLIVGGGYVGNEKLQAVLKNSPATKITIVAKEFSSEIKELAAQFANVQLIQKAYSVEDLNNQDLVIAALNDEAISNQVVVDAKAKGLLVNVADKPDLCDFYLSSVVQKGNLKIAISTNGKSPTVAKRIKEVITEWIPEEIDEVLENMQLIRNNINGNFDEKVKQLNELTKVLVAKQSYMQTAKTNNQKKWPRIVLWSLLAFVGVLISHAILSFIPFHDLIDKGIAELKTMDKTTFLMMLLTGFLAQMVDGSMGMGYGTISTTFLLAIGVPPAIVSSRVHTARVFSSGVAGYSHHRFGNINKKLFKSIVITGIIGAVTGASLAVLAQHHNVSWVRIPLSIYTAYLGYYIIKKAFKKKTNAQEKVKRSGWLAAFGGFFDAFAGGGWGALVTSTLIAKRRSPRYVIGSVCLAEFFVVLASAITFFVLLKHLPILDVLGLILGGVIAGPIAARLVGKLPIKTMYVAVGLVVIITSLFTLYKVLSKYNLL